MERKYSKIIEGKFIKKRFKYERNKGIVYCIKFRSDVHTSFANIDSKKICIKDKNYIWFEVYSDEKNYLLTIMCNDTLDIIQWYFDVSKITNSNINIPYQDDLYLDLVITPMGKNKILDEDELLEAMERKIISKKDFHQAYEVLEKLKNMYANNFEYLLDFTRYIFGKFMEDISNGKI